MEILNHGWLIIFTLYVDLGYAYVIDPVLYNGENNPKWYPRSLQGTFVDL